MSQWQDNTTEVLIVGAGPTGLMIACQLALRGISFRIIDKKDHPTNYSGALILQAKSIEILDQLGIAQTAIQQGIIAREIKLLFRGMKSFSILVNNIGHGLSQFPYLLMLEQSKTEQILADFIIKYGFAIERKTELLRFNQDDEGVTAILKLPDGEGETLKAKYLIAADGGHSIVREILAIPFLGSTHPVSLFVTDCKAEMNLPADTICFSFSNMTTTGFFPLKEERWRIDGTLPEEPETNGTLTFEEIAKSFNGKIRMKVKLYHPGWFSIFHSHQRYAASFHQNRCFLVGDAAHIHNPVGAQGMNTGLQDACNLAWKLALVIRNQSKESLLETYTSERIPIVKSSLRATERIFKLVTSQHILTKSFRVYLIPLILKLILPFLIRQKVIRQFFFRGISEIGIQYRRSPLSYHASLGKFPSCAPKPGDRLPYIVYNDGGVSVNIQEKVKGSGFHLFAFIKGISFIEILLVAEKHAHLITMETIPCNPETRKLFEKLGLENGGFYLIRPDMYIAYRSVKPEARHFESYLQRFLLE